MEIVTEIPIQGRDFELIDERYVLMGDEDKLILYDMNTKSWCGAIDLKPYGIKSVSRLSYKNKRLILVNSPS